MFQVPHCLEFYVTSKQQASFTVRVVLDFLFHTVPSFITAVVDIKHTQAKRNWPLLFPVHLIVHCV